MAKRKPHYTHGMFTEDGTILGHARVVENGVEYQKVGTQPNGEPWPPELWVCQDSLNEGHGDFANLRELNG